MLELPYGNGIDEGVDHPEGMAIVEADGATGLLVVHDSPREGRARGATVEADLYPLP